MRRRAIPSGLLVVAVAACVSTACNSAFDGTFRVDELSILGVRLQPAELVYDVYQLKYGQLDEIPLPDQLHLSALAVNPESLGGQDAIEAYHWAIGDPPIPGTPTLVSTGSSLLLEGDAVLPAMSIFDDGDGVFSPREFGELLDEGPVQLPLVVTAIAGRQSVSAVKMITIRGDRGGDLTPNQNPSAEGLKMGDFAEWSEVWLLQHQDTPLDHTQPPDRLQRGSRVMITVDPEDDGKDSDVASTMYTTAGSINWSSESMRSWWLEVPEEDHPFETFHIYVVLRDPGGAQSWHAIHQGLE